MIMGVYASMDSFKSVRSGHERHYVFEYLDALFDGLQAEYYVEGTALCAFNFKRSEIQL